MKLALTLVFFSFWTSFNRINSATGNIAECQQLSFNVDTDENLSDQFKKEYSFSVSVKKTFWTIFNRKSVTPSFQIDDTLAKFLCTCMLFKIQQLVVQNADQNENKIPAMYYGEIFQHTTFRKSKLGIYIPPYCVILPFYEHHFPATYCRLDEMEYLLAKSPDKAVNQKQVYNLYAAKVTGWYENDAIYNMVGFFKDVDLEAVATRIS